MHGYVDHPLGRCRDGDFTCRARRVGCACGVLVGSLGSGEEEVGLKGE
jgi:hypothetical protein